MEVFIFFLYSWEVILIILNVFLRVSFEPRKKGKEKLSAEQETHVWILSTRMVAVPEKCLCTYVPSG